MSLTTDESELVKVMLKLRGKKTHEQIENTNSLGTENRMECTKGNKDNLWKKHISHVKGNSDWSQELP